VVVIKSVLEAVEAAAAVAGPGSVVVLEVEHWEKESEAKVFGEVAGLEAHEASAVGAVE